MRDKKIDLLRFIGLSSLIMVHIDCPGWLFQLLNFSVPLIVIASAMAMSYTQWKGDYWSYVIKRIKRLFFPVWLFLTFYFIFLKVTNLAPNYLTFQNIIDNYTISNNGGFMWIIRVFLLVALVAPFIAQLDRKIKSNRKYLAILLVGYLLYEGLMHLSAFVGDGALKEFINFYVDYALGYGMIFALGMRIRKLSTKELWFVGGFAMIVFVILGAYHFVQEGHFVQTQKFKYPPSAYYVSYAIVACLITWALVDKFVGTLVTMNIWIESAVMFIAQNTLWLYFWHTIALFVSYRMHEQNFLMKYFVVYGLSILAVFIQNKIVKKVVLSRVENDRARNEIKALLTG